MELGPLGECPCWMGKGGCCDNPDTFTPKHKCEKDDDADEFCEACFTTECRSCGAWCICDL